MTRRPKSNSRWIRTVAAFTLALAVAACGTDQGGSALVGGGRADQSDLPQMRRFGPTEVTQTSRSNTAIAQDFLDLTFALETGRPLTRFTRFEGPISLRVTGTQKPPTLEADLSELLARLRSEAGIAISRVASGSDANITIETLPERQFNRSAPNTACIVAPNVSDWTSFRRAKRRSLSWADVEVRDRLAIFIPEDVAPQEIRDCLHEELAQALGPLNDLYRLPDSVFNDDNIHSVLTGFDMLMLRLTYAPELKTGMSRAEVADRLPALLSRFRPSERGGAGGYAQTDPEWDKDVSIAMNGGGYAQRVAAAKRAISRALENGWSDTRAGFSYFLLGRLLLTESASDAESAFLNARAIYGASPQLKFHAAHVDMHLSAIALYTGRYSDASRIAARAIPDAARAQNAALLASLMLTRSEALNELGLREEARALRLDSLGWARYGFGTDRLVLRSEFNLAADTR